MWIRQSGLDEMANLLKRKGEEMKEVYFPVSHKPGFAEELMGVGGRLFSISKGIFYYLIENEDEEWELKRYKIK